MQPTTVNVTPEIASEWLKSNKGNRNISKESVKRYADMMKSGKWFGETNDDICFDTSGSLINGQHRLAAVIESGATIQFSVKFGVRPETFIVMDQGRRRTVAQVSTSVKSASAVFSTCAVAMSLEKNWSVSSSVRTKWAEIEKLEWFNNHPEIEPMVSFAVSLYSRSGKIAKAKQPAGLFLYFVGDTQQTRDYLEGCYMGSADKTEQAIHSWMLRMSRHQFPNTYNRVGSILAALIYGWNKKSKGAVVSIVRSQIDLEIPVRANIL